MSQQQSINVHEEDSVSSLESLSVCGESATLTRHVPYQRKYQWSIFQSSPQPLCNPLPNPSQVRLPQSYQLLIQPYMHQSLNFLATSFPHPVFIVDPSNLKLPFKLSAQTTNLLNQPSGHI